MKTLPELTVLVRHGRTDANDVHSARNRGEPVDRELVAQVYSTPDWKIKLNTRGIEQAKDAGDWLARHLGGVASFDVRYCTYHARGRQTAAYLGQTDAAHGWVIDDRLGEQHYGSFGLLEPTEFKERYPEFDQLRASSPWYVTYPGGESGAGMRERYRSFAAECLETREVTKALVVAHSGLIGAARYHYEQLLPEEHETIERDETMPIKNGSILMYTDPIDNVYTRRRFVLPGRQDSGWQEINTPRSFSSQDLLAQIESIE